MAVYHFDEIRYLAVAEALQKIFRGAFAKDTRSAESHK